MNSEHAFIACIETNNTSDRELQRTAEAIALPFLWVPLFFVQYSTKYSDLVYR